MKKSVLMFPKQVKRKKRQKRTQSILQEKDGRCFICMHMEGDWYLKQTQEHHVFGGARRQISEREGLKIYLCTEHHLYGRYAVHRNKNIDNIIKNFAQMVWMKKNPDRSWMELMGKNYIEEYEEKRRKVSEDV